MKALEMHPLNVDFTWQSSRSSRRILSREQATSFDESGFCVVESAFDARDVASLVAEIDPLEEEFEEWLRSQPGGRVAIARVDEITFTTHLVARRPCATSSPDRRSQTSVPTSSVPDVRLYWDQAVYKKPDTEASFPWHQDNGYAFLEPQQYLTCWIALTDVTEENGCPWVAPGLHRFGTLRHRATPTGLICFEEVDDPVSVPIRAGGIVVFSSLTPHCTGPNITEAVRKAYIVQYAPDGACVIPIDEVGAAHRQPANAPDRQFPVLVDGVSVRGQGEPPHWRTRDPDGPASWPSRTRRVRGGP